GVRRGAAGIDGTREERVRRRPRWHGGILDRVVVGRAAEGEPAGCAVRHDVGEPGDPSSRMPALGTRIPRSSVGKPPLSAYSSGVGERWHWAGTPGTAARWAH